MTKRRGIENFCASMGNFVLKKIKPSEACDAVLWRNRQNCAQAARLPWNTGVGDV
jgi:hypothetical protein